MFISPRRDESQSFRFLNRNQLPLLHRRDQIFENVATQWRFACECGSQRVVDDILSLPTWLAAVKGSKKSTDIRSKFIRIKGIGGSHLGNTSCDWREDLRSIIVRNPKIAKLVKWQSSLAIQDVNTVASYNAVYFLQTIILFRNNQYISSDKRAWDTRVN